MAKKSGYGQFCPVAQASEIFAERWTPLILRELMCASHRFSDLRRGIPQMSPSLLSQRLKELEYAGVVERRTSGGAKHAEYFLTAAGEALRPVVEMLGFWGHQWLKRELLREDLDPGFLMWDIRRGVRPDAIPLDGRVTVQFDLSDVPASKGRWWLVFDAEGVDLCMKPPGHEPALYVSSPVRNLVELWLGNKPLRDAQRTGGLELHGSKALADSFGQWFGTSRFTRLDGRGEVPMPRGAARPRRNQE